MSFQKAADLLRLAELATARYQGVSLAEIEAEFGGRPPHGPADDESAGRAVPPLHHAGG